jgi:hypothetical protein
MAVKLYEQHNNQTNKDKSSHIEKDFLIKSKAY